MVEGYVALAYPKGQMKSRDDIPAIPHPSLHVDLINQGKALERLGLNRARPVLVLCPGPSSARPNVGRRALRRGGAKAPRRGMAGVDLRFGQGRGRGQHHPRSDQPLSRPNCHVLAGKTSLHEAIDLMALAGRVIANDSGLMHVAAALNRPLIGVYGSTSPSIPHRWRTGSRSSTPTSSAALLQAHLQVRPPQGA